MTERHDLYADLESSFSSSDYKHALRIADQILTQSNKEEDPEAFRMKILSWIYQDKFETTLKVIENEGNDFFFEKCYLQYRTGRLDAVIEAGVDEREQRNQFLMAQVFYSLEDYDRSQQIYNDLLGRVTDSELVRNIIINLFAVYVSGGFYDGCQELMEKYGKKYSKDFEYCYNVGCYYLARDDYTSAGKFFDIAKGIQEHNNLLNVQIGYLNQVLGNDALAEEIYLDLMNNATDQEAKAVATNNYISSGFEKNHVEAFRKFKLLKNIRVQRNLKDEQKSIVGYNNGLYLLNNGEIDKCRELINLMQEEFPNSDLFPILQAAVYLKKNNAKKSEELMQKYIEDHPNDSTRVKLTLAQILYERGHMKETFETLESIEELKNTPIMTSTLVSLNEKMHDTEGSIAVLDNTIDMLDPNHEFYPVLLRKVGDLKLKHRDFTGAVNSYKLLHSRCPDDETAVPSLVLALSHLENTEDQIDAYLNEMQVPNISHFDVDELEAFVIPEISVVSKNVDKREIILKKNKRKNKPPKSTSKPLDPERWLPVRERSYYKGRKNKQKKIRSQGIATVDDNLDVTKTKIEKAEIQNILPPRGSKKTRGSKKKRGKK